MQGELFPGSINLCCNISESRLSAFFAAMFAGEMKEIHAFEGGIFINLLPVFHRAQEYK